MKSRPALERFWEKVLVAEGCWLWRAQISTQGYGCFSLQSRLCYAHRFSWAIHNGPIPLGLYVLHQCDVRACVRPDHLFLGTQHDNNLDRDRKGRVRHGEQHPYAKLTEAQVQAIRRDTRPQTQIGMDYGIHQMTVSDLKRGVTWKHVR